MSCLFVFSAKFGISFYTFGITLSWCLFVLIDKYFNLRDSSYLRKIFFWIHETFLFFYNRISILKRVNVNVEYQTKLGTNVIGSIFLWNLLTHKTQIWVLSPGWDNNHSWAKFKIVLVRKPGRKFYYFMAKFQGSGFSFKCYYLKEFFLQVCDNKSCLVTTKLLMKNARTQLKWEKGKKGIQSIWICRV